MLPNSEIQVSYTFNIIGLIADAESTLKVMNDTRCKLFRNAIFKRTCAISIEWNAVLKHFRN